MNTKLHEMLKSNITLLALHLLRTVLNKQFSADKAQEILDVVLYEYIIKEETISDFLDIENSLFPDNNS